jgi:protocatechuate 3,4-dioxygenase beta subunit
VTTKSDGRLPDLDRREMLGLLGAAGAVALTGINPLTAGATPAPAPMALGGLDCIVTPAQMEGPYFLDAKLNRPDIRLDPTNGKVSEGLPLRLRIAVARVDGNACAPVAGAMVDVWQCDALGLYSGFQDANGFFDTRGEQFLRGYQITDARGGAEFETIYPGWYRGRAVHIHFKVRVPGEGQRGHEFTSQWYFDEAITDQVHARAPYAAKGTRDRRNEQDGIYRQGNSGAGLMLRLSRSGDGYLGEYAIGLRVA